MQWDKLDDKLAVGGLGFAALIVLWASTGLIGAIDKLPLIPAVFEFVGILFSGWFVYRYLLFKPDREELLKVIDDAKSKITGQWGVHNFHKFFLGVEWERENGEEKLEEWLTRLAVAKNLVFLMIHTLFCSTQTCKIKCGNGIRKKPLFSPIALGFVVAQCTKV
jgi:energy-coupling factor transporter transmembrane protein EcfT